MAKDIHQLWNGDAGYMAGTEGTGRYHVTGASSRGRVGTRFIADNTRVRIRLEPAPNIAPGVMTTLEKTLTREQGWKQPGDQGQDRFSKVVLAGGEHEVVEMLEELLGKGTLKSFVKTPYPGQQPVAQSATAS